MSAEPLAGCALALSADDLSAWRDGAVDGATKARLDAHIAGCAACRARLAEYDAIAQALRAIPTPEPASGFGLNPRPRADAGQPRRRSAVRRRRALGGLGAVAAVALLLLAFTQVFGRLGLQLPPASATSSPTSLATATATAQPTATVAPVPALPALPTTTIASGVCGQHFPYAAPLTPAHGLVVTQFSSLGVIAYPLTQIPSSQPDAPMLYPTSAASAGWEANTVPVVNPSLQEGRGGYVLAICNPSSQPHIISAVRASLVWMTPFTDQLSAWEICRDGFYDPVSRKAISPACGGSDQEDEYLHAAFAADAPVGASVTATQTSSNIAGRTGDGSFGPLPIALKPGQMMLLEVGVTPPSAAGYYSFSFALTVDGSSTGTVAYSLTTLLAPVAHEWSGAACQTSAMQALIAKMPTPPANSDYICPAS